MPRIWTKNLNRKPRRLRDEEFRRNQEAILRIIEQMPNETVTDKLARSCMNMQLLVAYREGVRFC